MRRTASLIALALFAPAPALAQEDELIVTATRTATPAARLPARVETLDREAIEARGLATLAEALGQDAVQSGGAGALTSLFLRGANSKHALALFDGVRLNDPANPTAQYDFGLDTLGALERVETLRGPASSIYGSDAIGGVVNLLPRRGGEDGLFAEAGLGSLETRRALLGASGAAANVEYGASYEWFDAAGFDQIPERMSTFGDDADGASLSTLTATARAQFGALGFDALVRWRESESAFDSFSAGPSGFQRGDDPDLEADATQSLWRLGADTGSGPWLWRLAGGQVRSDYEERDGAASSADAQGTRSFIDASARYSPASARTVTFGLSWAREEADNAATAFADALGAAEEQSAAFVIAQSDFGEHWSATASARVDDYEGFGTQGTYSAGLVGRVGALRAFASYGTAFKAPSLGERFGTGFFNVGNPDLSPERSRSWELGADWRVAEGFSAGASYYQTRVDDLIEYSFADLANVNIGRADIDGAEIFAEAAPAPWLSLRASYAWTDAVNADTGAQLLRRPEHAWRLQAEIAPSARASLTLIWTFVGERADVTYDDDGFFLDAAGRVDSFALGALAGTYDLTEKIELFARIDNLADETYEQPAAFAGAPRTGFVGLRAKY